jgi:hypothetical protein
VDSLFILFCRKERKGRKEKIRKLSMRSMRSLRLKIGKEFRRRMKDEAL